MSKNIVTQTSMSFTRGFVKITITFLILVIVSSSCSTRNEIIPNTRLSKNGIYHCYSFNVQIYKIYNLSISDNFFQYPVESLCNEKSNCNLIKWTKFSELKKEERNTIIAYINKCDGNRDLFNHINLDKEIYFAGCYRDYMSDKTENYRLYFTLVFIDVEQEKMHLFKYIQDR
jgi:hypothetical protein